jgi:hypothetical protein
MSELKQIIINFLPGGEHLQEDLRQLSEEQIKAYKRCLDIYHRGDRNAWTQEQWYSFIKENLERRGVAPDIAHYLASMRDNRRLEKHVANGIEF